MTPARYDPTVRDSFHAKAGGDAGLEAPRVLKRRLSDVVYQALRADATDRQPAAA